MGSGYYPLEVKYSESGQRLAKIADDLRELLKTRGDEYSRDALPAGWQNDQHDNAAYDGQYEAYMDLALELLERCIKRPPVGDGQSTQGSKE